MDQLSTCWVCLSALIGPFPGECTTPVSSKIWPNNLSTSCGTVAPFESCIECTVGLTFCCFWGEIGLFCRSFNQNNCYFVNRKLSPRHTSLTWVWTEGCTKAWGWLLLFCIGCTWLWGKMCLTGWGEGLLKGLIFWGDGDLICSMLLSSGFLSIILSTPWAPSCISVFIPWDLIYIPNSWKSIT